VSTAGDDGDWKEAGIGSDEYKKSVVGRFFERFEESVGSVGVKTVCIKNDAGFGSA
jgi:hypothetical protein